MPSRRRSATDPPEPADSATTDATESNPAALTEAEEAGVEKLLDIIAEAEFTPAPVAEGTATRSPNPLAGKRAYKVLQAIHHDGARIRAGEHVLLSPTSGLARSPFVRLIEDDADVPPAVAAAFDEAG